MLIQRGEKRQDRNMMKLDAFLQLMENCSFKKEKERNQKHKEESCEKESRKNLVL